jgi:hypothetical protein
MVNNQLTPAVFRYRKTTNDVHGSDISTHLADRIVLAGHLSNKPNLPPPLLIRFPHIVPLTFRLAPILSPGKTGASQLSTDSILDFGFWILDHPNQNQNRVIKYP